MTPSAPDGSDEKTKAVEVLQQARDFSGDLGQPRGQVVDAQTAGGGHQTRQPARRVPSTSNAQRCSPKDISTPPP